MMGWQLFRRRQSKEAKVKGSDVGQAKSAARAKSYATSRYRIVILAMMLVGALVVMGDRVTGQTTPANTPGAVTANPGGGSVGTGTGFSYTQLIPNDPVTYIIGALSFVAVTLIVQGFIKTRKSVYMPEASVTAISEMIQNRQFKELMEFTEQDDSFVSKSLNPALKRAPSFAAMKEALETAVGEQTANSFRKIEYLNIIGNLGPLLGLLGTVLGMIEAFAAMQRAGGQANVQELTGGIATALAHTFLGLALAIPCLAAFGILRTLTDRLTVEAALKAEELLLMTKPPEAKSILPTAPASAPAQGGAPVAAPIPAVTSVRNPTAPTYGK